MDFTLLTPFLLAVFQVPILTTAGLFFGFIMAYSILIAIESFFRSGD